jgi:hypothetical protein
MWTSVLPTSDAFGILPQNGHRFIIPTVASSISLRVNFAIVCFLSVYCMEQMYPNSNQRSFPLSSLQRILSPQ